MKYIIHRDEIINAKEEINELKRLLDEAKERLNNKYKRIRERTWSEWLFEFIGIY